MPHTIFDPSPDHGGLSGLSDDDHSQYALLAGRAGGQTLIGGTAASEDLTLQSTSNATRGNIINSEPALAPVDAVVAGFAFIGETTSGMRLDAVGGTLSILRQGANRVQVTSSRFVSSTQIAVLAAGRGTEALPAFHELVDTDTGLFLPVDDEAGISTGAVAYLMRNRAVTTSDATVTVLATVTLSDTTLLWLEALVVGRDTAGTERAFYVRRVRAHRQGAGAVLGTIDAAFTDETSAGLDATFTVSGNDVRVSVTGIAATTINWRCSLRYQVVA